MTGELGRQYLKQYLQDTEQGYLSYLQQTAKEAYAIGEIPGKMVDYFIEIAKGGKRIRGGLIQLGYEIAGGTDIKSVQDASLFAELFHAAVLIHDDVMDQDKLRRGVTSFHIKFAEIGKQLKIKDDPSHYGESMAYGIGDTIFYLSWKKLMESSFTDSVKVAVGKLYSECVVKVAYGQVMDITNVSLSDVKENDILTVLRYKTAEYTGMYPLLIGAAFGQMNDLVRRQALIEYGKAFGWAFQIQDDILGLYGDEEEFGKPVGSDLREGKNTLLMLNLLKMGTNDDRQFLKKTLGNKNATREDVIQMRDRVKSSGAYRAVYDLGQKYVSDGIAQIPTITPEKKYQDILESLITYMMERVV